MTNCIYNDGGRLEALKQTNDDDKFFGSVRDCVTRSIAIVTGLSYVEVWNAVATVNKEQGGKHSANHGVFCHKPQFIVYMHSLGFVYVELPRVMFKDAPLPEGRLVLDFAGHCAALIDGVLHDTYNPTPGGRKILRGYWVKRPARAALFNVCNTAGKPINRAPLNFEQATTMAVLMSLNYKTQTKILPV